MGSRDMLELLLTLVMPTSLRVLFAYWFLPNYILCTANIDSDARYY
jgi:hypothetical protein